MTHPSDIAGLSEGLSVVSNQINRWIEWERGHRAKEHLSTDDDTHIMALPVPFWPTHGQFKAWIKLFSEAATALDSLSARVKELEQVRDQLDERCATYERDCLRAEQQRDKAYERAAKVAMDYYTTTNSREMRKDYERLIGSAIAFDIRRLASGPEVKTKGANQ